MKCNYHPLYTFVVFPKRTTSEDTRATDLDLANRSLFLRTLSVPVALAWKKVTNCRSVGDDRSMSVRTSKQMLKASMKKEKEKGERWEAPRTKRRRIATVAWADWRTSCLPKGSTNRRGIVKWSRSWIGRRSGAKAATVVLCPRKNNLTASGIASVRERGSLSQWWRPVTEARRPPCCPRTFLIYSLISEQGTGEPCTGIDWTVHRGYHPGGTEEKKNVEQRRRYVSSQSSASSFAD